jgi:DNA-binding NarL/FixJ family response regulator
MNATTAILLTDSAALAVGLRALLLSIPPITSVECLVDADSLLEKLENIQPALIVVDASLIGAKALRSLRDLSPASRRVIFVDNVSDVVLLQAWIDDRTETVIVKGADPAWLAGEFEGLLAERAAL